MNKHLASKLFLRLLICVGSYWISAILYPYNFYCDETSLPFMKFLLLLKFFGLATVAGAITWIILLGLDALGGKIGITKNLIFFFLYHFVFCTALPWAQVTWLKLIDIQPNEMFLLLGFIPALLYSIVYSYERSHETAAPANAEKQ